MSRIGRAALAMSELGLDPTDMTAEETGEAWAAITQPEEQDESEDEQGALERELEFQRDYERNVAAAFLNDAIAGEDFRGSGI